jgi:hypothetical protein
MGKYILLEFEDDAQAEALISKINAAHARGKRFWVVGIFQRPPKKRCECPLAESSRLSTTKRHYKTGFVYCTRCRRVMPGRQAPLNQMDILSLAWNWFRLGLTKEAELTLSDSQDSIIAHNGLARNFPIVDRSLGSDAIPGDTPVRRQGLPEVMG